MNKYIMIATNAFFIGSVIIMSMTFFSAYLGNNTTIVDINHFGEAKIEAIFMTIMIVLIIYRLHYEYKELKSWSKNKKY